MGDGCVRSPRRAWRVAVPAWSVLVALGLAAGPSFSQEQLGPLKVGDLDLTPLGGGNANGWERVCPTPPGYIPQGLAVRRGRLYLSAYQAGRTSALFELADDESRFDKVFDLPADATHTSGIDFHPGNQDLLFAVDYDSDRIYVIDFVQSRAQHAAVVVTSIGSGLDGTSACCFVEVPRRGCRLLVTDFAPPGFNVFFAYDAEANRLQREERLRYRNYGFSQGAKAHDGFVYETGNQLLGSYVVKHSLAESLNQDRLVPIEVWAGPTRMIEDIAFVRGLAWVADEGRLGLYRKCLGEKESTLRKD